MSAPLADNTTVIGAGAVHVWVRSSTPDVDLQATVSEVRPDGSMLASDVQPMPKGRFVEVVIPLYYEGHVYRAGSRIRVTISAPNGTQPIWAFGETEPKGTSTVSIEFAGKMPSSLILPAVPGVSVPTGLPACPSLRNEPCRPYAPLANRAARG